MAQSVILDRYDKLIYRALWLYVLRKDVEWNDNDRILLILIALSTGLTIDEISELTWEDILDVAGIDGLRSKTEIYVRRYANYLHPIIRIKLETIYKQGALSPKITSPIFSEKITERELFIVLTFFLYEKELFSNYKEFGHPMDASLFNIFFQATFGRRVMRVCGFDKETARQLRRHFRVKTNNEVLHLLALEEPLQYSLSNIRLDVQDYLNLKSKNFDNGYKFQNFSSLDDFLTSSKPNTQRDAAMKCLMVLSLHNGIKISSLLKIKTSEIIVEPDNYRGFNVKKIVFNGSELVINSKVNSAFYSYFYVFGFDPSLPLFRTNRGNAISSSSLYRELPETMRVLGHKYYKSITLDSFIISWGRKVITVKGFHKPTIKALKTHLKIKTEKSLYKFLFIEPLDTPKQQYNRYEKDIYKAICYDFPTERLDVLK
jgi:hypothetical protein